MKSAVLHRALSATCLLVWSAALLWFHGSGRIIKYLAPDFRLIALLGGLGLLVVGAFNLLTCRKEASCGHSHGDGEDCHSAHDSHDLHPLMALGLMLVPLVLSLTWTKDGYSAAALSRKGLYDTPAPGGSSFLSNAMPAMTREELLGSHRQTDDGYYEFSLMELFFSTGDRELQGIIEGVKVQTEGRIIDEQVRNPNGTRKRLYRLFMTCCAADSRPVPIVLEFGETPPPLPENGWTKVTGTMHYKLEEGTYQAILVVDQAIAAEAPIEESFMRN